MNTRIRQPEQRPPQPAGNGAPNDSQAGELRERARDLLGAADRAIEQALSPDSSRFLRNSVQTGGQ